jgi:hypothetical protein
VKIGAENSKKTLIAIGLLVVALFLTLRMISNSLTSSAAAPVTTATTATATRPTAPATRRTTRGQARTPKKEGAAPVTPRLDPRLRLDTLKSTENTEYTGKGRNIFMAQAEEIPKPIAPPIKPEPVAVVDPGPPPPPPPPRINLKFFGFANQQGGKRIFLSSGDDVFVATEGEIVQRRYKIVRVNPNNIEVQDVLNNNVQTIPLTSG